MVADDLESSTPTGGSTTSTTVADAPTTSAGLKVTSAPVFTSTRAATNVSKPSFLNSNRYAPGSMPMIR